MIAGLFFENYKCSICNLVEFSDKHTVQIENVFEKAHKSCGGPFRRETKSLSNLSILDKVFHLSILLFESIAKVSTLIFILI